jgi:hypothetical protein
LLEIIPIEKQFLFMWVWSLCIIPCEQHIQKQIINKKEYMPLKILHHAGVYMIEHSLMEIMRQGNILKPKSGI